ARRAAIHGWIAVRSLRASVRGAHTLLRASGCSAGQEPLSVALGAALAANERVEVRAVSISPQHQAVLPGGNATVVARRAVQLSPGSSKGMASWFITACAAGSVHPAWRRSPSKTACGKRGLFPARTRPAARLPYAHRAHHFHDSPFFLPHSA